VKNIDPWAWLIVLGTALALSWWSLDALALHFGVPKVLAATKAGAAGPGCRGGWSPGHLRRRRPGLDAR
jgi:hypothetical protein